MDRKGWFVGAVVVFLVLGVSSAHAEDRSDIAARLVAWEKAYNSGMFDELAAHYTEDATRMPYQAPSIQGRQAISAVNRTFHDAGAVKIDLEVLGAESHGTLAWAHGTYHLMLADGSTFQTGKWMNVSKKVGDKWLIQADIWNTDAP